MKQKHPGNSAGAHIVRKAYPDWKVDTVKNFGFILHRALVEYPFDKP